MGWFVINILVPFAIPGMFMLLARLVPLPPAISVRTRLITLVQDGQLGWVALGYATSCAYDGYAYVVKAGERAVFWAAPALGVAIALIAASGFMAALGALYPYDNTPARPTSFKAALRQYSSFAGTFVALLFAAFIYTMVHY